MSHGVITGLLSGIGTATAGWVIAVTTSALRTRARERRVADEAARNAVRAIEHTEQALDQALSDLRHRVDRMEGILWSIEARSHRVRSGDAHERAPAVRPPGLSEGKRDG